MTLNAWLGRTGHPFSPVPSSAIAKANPGSLIIARSQRGNDSRNSRAPSGGPADGVSVEPAMEAHSFVSRDFVLRFAWEDASAKLGCSDNLGDSHLC